MTTANSMAIITVPAMRWRQHPESDVWFSTFSLVVSGIVVDVVISGLLTVVVTSTSTIILLLLKQQLYP